ncbi:hypothetical protein ACM01_05990 [Streptomyces viridochromogenes]|uniref:Lipoprotein n=2 Tax=Streptomyces viridochromogenes TaxID=1938 RepID=A0A0J7ZK21_STRVR|nr:hypothetical protein ACM01_05990 [Streptomyces viridochromogenes]KOG25110.1 hypothetical protein ADK36_07055 [Streptomyces viridochromogenes]KOG26577.1 hypothetical protein ADK35_07745 [Streptomyces viridochromogenes]
MRQAFVSACAGVTVVGVVAVGCTSQQTQSAGSAGSRSQLREPTDTEQILLRRAQQTLVKACMEGAGFKYWIGPLPTVDELKGGGYVLTDVSWARKHGYGSRFKERLQDVQRNDPNNAYANSLPQEERVRYSKVLEGGESSAMLKAELPGGGAIQTPRHGCQADAKDQLYGDFGAWFRAEKIAIGLPARYVPDLLNDQRFVNAVESWSVCMGKAGHDYATPQEIREKLPDLTADMTKKEAYATEVDMAVAEATCATETALSRTAHALEDEYRNKQPQKYLKAVATYQRMTLAALPRAKDITRATG